MVISLIIKNMMCMWQYSVKVNIVTWTRLKQSRYVLWSQGLCHVNFILGHVTSIDHRAPVALPWSSETVMRACDAKPDEWALRQEGRQGGAAAQVVGGGRAMTQLNLPRARVSCLPPSPSPRSVLACMSVLSFFIAFPYSDLGEKSRFA